MLRGIVAVVVKGPPSKSAISRSFDHQQKRQCLTVKSKSWASNFHVSSSSTNSFNNEFWFILVSFLWRILTFLKHLNPMGYARFAIIQLVFLVQNSRLTIVPLCCHLTNMIICEIQMFSNRLPPGFVLVN